MSLTNFWPALWLGLVGCQLTARAADEHVRPPGYRQVDFRQPYDRTYGGDVHQPALFAADKSDPQQLVTRSAAIGLRSENLPLGAGESRFGWFTQNGLPNEIRWVRFDDLAVCGPAEGR